MRHPIFVPVLRPADRAALAAALRSPNAFTLRRAQIVLASAHGHKAAHIAAIYGCSDQAVRNIIRAYAARGVAQVSHPTELSVLLGRLTPSSMLL